MARILEEDMKTSKKKTSKHGRSSTESMIQALMKKEIPSKKPTGFLFLFLSTLSSSCKQQRRRHKCLLDVQTSQGKIFLEFQCSQVACIACIAL